MNKLITISIGLVIFASACTVDFQASTEAKPTQLATQALASLDDKQRTAASFTFDDKERFNWDFVPRETNRVPNRKGVPIKQLDAEQRVEFQALLKSALSATGYKRTEQIRMLEGVLMRREGETRSFTRDSENYFFSFFGSPGDGMWGWRLEGHHLCLNFTYEKDRLTSATPFCMGANPARVTEGDDTGLRVLAPLEDDARKLLQSLSDAQRPVALGAGKTLEVEARQKRKYDVPLPKGLPASELDDSQKKLLLAVIGHYTGNFTTDFATRFNDRIRKAGVDNIQITWRGSLKPEEKHSYIFHGPRFVISYVNDQNQALHVHAAIRELGADFGLD